MSNLILLKNGHVVDPVNKIDKVCDLLIEGTEIKEVGKIPTGKSKAQEIDLKGMYVLPGFVDMHVHLREPGREDEETVESGTNAAVAGGITAVACMPNTDPVMDTEAHVEFIMKKAKGAKAKVYPVGTITKGMQGKVLSDIGSMVRSGAVAVSEDGMAVKNSEIMKNALVYSKMFNIPVICHCEDADLARGGCMNEGEISFSLGMKGIPAASEEVIVARDILLGEYTGTRVHIAHVSTKGSLRLIKDAKSRGVEVTCETAPHYVIYTDEIIKGNFNTYHKMNPPLRTEEDRKAIIKAIKDGTIDAIATDHAPHSIEEKDVEFDQAPNGVTGLETSVGAIYDALVKPGIIDISKMAELMSVNPNKILNKKGGNLAPGKVADITVIDPKKKWTVKEHSFVSKSRNNPFIGKSFTGRAVLTIVDGEIVYDGLNK